MKKILYFLILISSFTYAQNWQTSGGVTSGSATPNVSTATGILPIANGGTNSSLGMATASYSLTVAATTTITGTTTNVSRQAYTSSALTAWTAVYASIGDGTQLVIDYLKTTATGLVLTFPASTVISAASDAVVSGVTATLTSTNVGRFSIVVTNINSVYKVSISQDVL